MADAKTANAGTADDATEVSKEVKQVIASEDKQEDSKAAETVEKTEQADENGGTDDNIEKEEGAKENEIADPNSWKPHEDGKSNEAEEKADNEGGEEKAEKKRVYNRKVVRLPRDVFDFMAKVEEDGVVRFNLTQFGVFYMNELKFMGTNTDAMVWDTVEVPLLNVSVPPTAKTERTLIVDHFSSEPEVREAQETRLKGILENREKLRQLIASGAKVDDGTDRKAAKRQRKKERREERKKQLEAEQKGGKVDETTKKRSAENTDSSTKGGVAAKQPRLDASAEKTFPKKSGAQQNGTKHIAPARNAGPKKRPLIPPRNSFKEWQSGSFYGRSAGRDSFRPPYQDARPREIPPLFPTRNPTNVSPWSRPPYQEDMHKLEQVMRRAAHDNSSSFEAVRQVERLGLGSAMGTMLNSAPERDMPMNTYNDVPTRQMPSLVDQAFNRRREEPVVPRYGEDSYGAGRYAGGRDAPIRDISSFVEPLDEFGDSSRKGSYPPVERITYPTIGGGSAGRGNTSIPPYGQSYSAFANESYGQRREYGGGARPRSVSPYGRTFYR